MLGLWRWRSSLRARSAMSVKPFESSVQINRSTRGTRTAQRGRGVEDVEQEEAETAQPRAEGGRPNNPWAEFLVVTELLPRQVLGCGLADAAASEGGRRPSQLRARRGLGRLRCERGVSWAVSAVSEAGHGPSQL